MWGYRRGRFGPRRGYAADRRRLVLVGGAAVAVGAAWGHFEAGWLRCRTRELALARFPADGRRLRVVHLSDFHLGVPSRGARAVERAAEWTAARTPDLVCITGDLVTHPRGVSAVAAVLARLPGAFAVFGNHDFGIARDPFARRAAPFPLEPAILLADDARSVEIAGVRVQVVGVDPRTYLAGAARPERLADPDADVRILLSHYPRIVDRLEPGIFDLVLAGHLHDGQITIPYVAGKLRLAHPRFPYASGLYHVPAAVLHVSSGLGTTFVPFRFFARPEVTELTLRSG